MKSFVIAEPETADVAPWSNQAKKIKTKFRSLSFSNEKFEAVNFQSLHSKSILKMSMTPLDGMKAALAATLQGIERYNPDNIPKLERYIDEQVSENGYDLEANLVSWL